MRIALREDAAALAALSEKTFRQTFDKDNSPEDMALFVAKYYGEEKQLAEILDPRRRIVLATAGDALIGYYHLSQSQPDLAILGPKPIELLRIYVDVDWHGKGVAHYLMKNAVEKSRAEGFQTLWLGVWENNFRAQAFYKKWKFVETGSHVFVLGTDRQRDLLFSKNLADQG